MIMVGSDFPFAFYISTLDSIALLISVIPRTFRLIVYRGTSWKERTPQYQYAGQLTPVDVYRTMDHQEDIPTCYLTLF